MTSVIIGILLGIIVVLLIKYSNLNIKYKYLKSEDVKNKHVLAAYFNTVHQLREIIVKNGINLSNDMNNIKNTSNNNVENYSVDDILDEIAEKGIENISKDKLEFLKNNGQ